MRLSIQEVVTGREMDRFIKFQWKIYKNDNKWVSPLLIDRKTFLNPKKNPFFKSAQVKFFMAYDEKKRPLGRIAAIISHNHLKTHNDGAGFFGLFECINDQNVANLLFEKAASFLRSQGMGIMRGPMSMNVNDEIGLLISGFDTPPAVMLPHNPPYYEALVNIYGFKKEVDLFAYYMEDHDGKPPERLTRGVELVKKRYKITIRPADMKRFDEEIEKLHEVYSRAWEKNWKWVAMTDEEFHHLAKDLKLIAIPGLVLLAEIDGKVIGVSVALPDINQVLKKIPRGRLFPFGIFKLLWYKRKIDMIRLTIMGVIKEYRHMGIETCFVHETYRKALELGVWRCDMSQILETNAPMNNVLIKLGARIYKTYRIYDYKL
jgi:GNAT superfamily N-acetyltransferase